LFSYCWGNQWLLLDVWGFRDGDGRRSTVLLWGSLRRALDAAPNDLRHRLIDGAGMGLLLGYAELGQHFQNAVGGNLKLPRQLIDADLIHK